MPPDSAVPPVQPGAALDRAFAIFREHFAVLYPLALILGLVEAMASVALRGTDLAPLALSVSLLTGTLLQGMVAGLVRDVEAGRTDLDVGQLAREVLPVLAPLLAVSLLAALGVGVGLVLLIVPGLVLMTIWAVAAPVLVIERTGVLGAFRRSRELVRGNGWPVLGLLVIVLLLVVTVTVVAVLISTGLSDGLGTFVEVLLVAFAAPISALATAVLYFQLRAAHGEGPVASTPAPAERDAFGR